MPTRTKANAIEDAAKDPKKTTKGGILQSNKPMDIFKKNANAYKDKDAKQHCK